MKQIIIIFSCFIFSLKVLAIENKIIIKVNEEIITSIDIKNEQNYLMALNPNIKNLDKNKLYSISKNSLIREKIKKKEILNYTDNTNLNQKYLNQIIQQRYSRLNIGSKDEFINYLLNYNISIETIESKISIEALWNQLIYQKFSKNVKINKVKLEQELELKKSKDQRKLLLSEILFKIDNKNILEKKYSQILNDIKKSSFESAALTHSISDSSSVGGKLGWINQSSLNKTINNKLVNLNKGEITKPILTPNGYLVLKIDDIELTKIKFDKEKELKELINSKTNEQLNQQSILYFNKIKKNTEIDEL